MLPVAWGFEGKYNTIYNMKFLFMIVKVVNVNLLFHGQKNRRNRRFYEIITKNI